MSSKQRLPPHTAAVTLVWLSSALSCGLGYVVPHVHPVYNDIPDFDPNVYPVNQDIFIDDPPSSSLRLFNPPFQLQPAPPVRPLHIPQFQNRPLPSVQNLPSSLVQRGPRLANEKEGFNNITINGSNSGNVNVCGKGGTTGNGSTVDHSGEKVVNFKGYNNNNIHGSFAGNVNNGHVYVNIDMGALNVTELFSNKKFLQAVTNVTELRAQYLYNEIKKLQILEERNKTLGDWFPRLRRPRA